MPVLTGNHKADKILFAKLRDQRQIGGYGLSARILCLPVIPAVEVLAFHGRGFRQNQGIMGPPVILIGLKRLIFDQIGDHKDILHKFRPDLEVPFLGRSAVVEISPAVNPFAAVVFPCGHSRNLVHTIGGVDIHRSGCQNLRLPFIRIEGDRPGDHIVVRHNSFVLLRHKAAANSGSRRIDFRSLIALNNRSDRPIRGIILARNRRRQLISDRLILDHIHLLILPRIAVVESQQPGFVILGRDGHALSGLIVRETDLGFSFIPPFESIMIVLRNRRYIIRIHRALRCQIKRAQHTVIILRINECDGGGFGRVHRRRKDRPREGGDGQALEKHRDHDSPGDHMLCHRIAGVCHGFILLCRKGGSLSLYAGIPRDSLCPGVKVLVSRRKPPTASSSAGSRGWL